jgi:hypothetical protein
MMEGELMTGREKQTSKRVVGAAANKVATPPIVAVHEAGHAVARVLVAGELGYSLDEVISCIELGTNLRGRSVDGRSATEGPVFSRDIDEAARQQLGETYLSDHATLKGTEVHEFMSEMIELGVLHIVRPD